MDEVFRPGTAQSKRGEVLEEWYRDQLRECVSPMIKKWESILNVKVSHLSVQRMKTRWGSCNTTTKKIRLNTNLTHKKPELIEYVVIHELLHLIEPSHNSRFVALMDQYVTNWRFCKDELNRSLLRYEEWKLKS